MGVTKMTSSVLQYTPKAAMNWGGVTGVFARSETEECSHASWTAKAQVETNEDMEDFHL